MYQPLLFPIGSECNRSPGFDGKDNAKFDSVDASDMPEQMWNPACTCVSLPDERRSRASQGVACCSCLSPSSPPSLAASGAPPAVAEAGSALAKLTAAAVSEAPSPSPAPPSAFPLEATTARGATLLPPPSPPSPLAMGGPGWRPFAKKRIVMSSVECSGRQNVTSWWCGSDFAKQSQSHGFSPDTSHRPFSLTRFLDSGFSKRHAGKRGGVEV
mmetsp:Transcript_140545/g.350355  ORF Transcript_140545/g.350355 Transcript_140545/m.350355 type:complete len:214 (+) Transcript_140545:3017-3658(+)